MHHRKKTTVDSFENQQIWSTVLNKKERLIFMSLIDAVIFSNKTDYKLECKETPAYLHLDSKTDVNRVCVSWLIVLFVRINRTLLTTKRIKMKQDQMLMIFPNDDFIDDHKGIGGGPVWKGKKT